MGDSKGGQDNPTVHLVKSDDAEPSLTLKAGMRFEVRATNIVTPTMSVVEPDDFNPPVGGRLCGGNRICIALIEI